MLRLVNLFTDVDEVCLDSFMGSGTTAIACVKTGRRFVGIERDPEHFATAVARIERELQQQTLAR